MRHSATSFWMVDVIKAVASQLIVWHHFVSYGPMVKTVYPYAPRAIDWLYVDARMAVQAFLVIGGFFAARALAPSPDRYTFQVTRGELGALLGQRYVRLIRPYLLALVLALACAACSRWLLDDPDTPAAPTFKQLLFHILLIHDIAGADALSTGVWYVAADMQLFAMLLLVLLGAERLRLAAIPQRDAAVGLLLGLSAVSLVWASRSAALEVWGIYFFGAYALGVMVHWSVESRSARYGLAVLLGIYALALCVEWRERLLVSLFTAALLALGLYGNWQPGMKCRRLFGFLSRISYSVFLVHYPVVMLTGSFVGRMWPHSVSMAVVGLLISWGGSLVLAQLLYRWVEAPGHRLHARPA